VGNLCITLRVALDIFTMTVVDIIF
jgi:hypothetical protein